MSRSPIHIWGLNTNTLLTLFKSIIVPKLLYGVSVWSHCLNKKWCINKLRNAQYQMTKCITRSYKTAHRESLLIISNLLPMNLIALELAALRFMLFKNLSFSLSSAKAIGLTLSDCDLVNVPTEVCKIFRSISKPPWVVPALKYSSITATEIRLLIKKPSSVTIFATTSLKENGTMALIVCYSTTVKATQEILLPKFISQIQAEVGAIQLAIRYAVANKLQYSTCYVISDSKAALNSTLLLKKVSNSASESRELILSNNDLFSFHCLPSSVFVEWIDKNGIAPTSTNFCLTTAEVSMSTLRQKISRKIHQLWEKEWTVDTLKGAITKKFFPAPVDAKCMKGVYISHQITQLLTGHCQLNQHFLKIKKIQSPLCDCYVEEESIEHFLFSCCRFESQRKVLKEACEKKEKKYPPSLAAVVKSAVIWKEVLKFIKETRRLDHNRVEETP